MALTNIEVVSVPVTDQDAAKSFYVDKLGFSVEIDNAFAGGSMRWVMLRPPGGRTAITLVTWFETMAAGSLRGAVLGGGEQLLCLLECGAENPFPLTRARTSRRTGPECADLTPHCLAARARRGEGAGRHAAILPAPGAQSAASSAIRKYRMQIQWRRWSR